LPAHARANGSKASLPGGAGAACAATRLRDLGLVRARVGRCRGGGLGRIRAQVRRNRLHRRARPLSACERASPKAKTQLPRRSVAQAIEGPFSHAEVGIGVTNGQQRHAAVLGSISDGGIAAGVHGRPRSLNYVAPRLAVWPTDDAQGGRPSPILRVDLTTGQANADSSRRARPRNPDHDRRLRSTNAQRVELVAPSRGTITDSMRLPNCCVAPCARDTGDGVPTRRQNRMADRFAATKRVDTGPGQGVAIARDIAVTQYGQTSTVECAARPGTIPTAPLSREASSADPALAG